MRRIELPENVGNIIEKLGKFGYDAYAVGGCVRDSILGKIPIDWDICTNALPKQTEAVFSEYKIIETGIKHGTVTLILNKIPYEITTFRTESCYSDCRRPDRVDFVKDIAEDLARRDFTVNAMAYNEKDGLIDLFSGCEDLKEGVIRCVRNPYERFSEDALRIMRAVRFAAVLGFKIDDETEKAAKDKKILLKNVAAERLNTEFTKTILSDYPEKIYKYRDIISVFVKNADRLKESDVSALSLLNKDKCRRLAALMLKITDISVSVRNVLRQMKYDNSTVECTVNIMDCPIPADLKECRVLAGKYGLNTVIDMLFVKKAIAEAESNREVLMHCERGFEFAEEISANRLCTKISELDINGRDLAGIGIETGTVMGHTLQKLLYAVFDEKVNNSKEDLIKYVKKHMG